jgi:hypothetical protein
MRKSHYIDLTGQRFGKLTVLKLYGRDKNGIIKWLCKCDCGSETIVYGEALKIGRTKSCGCSQTTHKMRHTRQYEIWCTMKKRCFNPNCEKYPIYGGRGITVCDKWLTFEGFWEDMQEGYADSLSIDRIDVNGNYEKSNCKWSTNIEQANNKTNSHLIEYNGEIHTTAEWAKIANVPYKTFHARIVRYKWPIEKALSTP